MAHQVLPDSRAPQRTSHGDKRTRRPGPGALRAEARLYGRERRLRRGRQPVEVTARPSPGLGRGRGGGRHIDHIRYLAAAENRYRGRRSRRGERTAVVAAAAREGHRRQRNRRHCDQVLGHVSTFRVDRSRPRRTPPHCPCTGACAVDRVENQGRSASRCRPHRILVHRARRCSTGVRDRHVWSAVWHDRNPRDGGGGNVFGVVDPVRPTRPHRAMRCSGSGGRRRTSASAGSGARIGRYTDRPCPAPGFAPIVRRRPVRPRPGRWRRIV